MLPGRDGVLVFMGHVYFSPNIALKGIGIVLISSIVLFLKFFYVLFGVL